MDILQFQQPLRGCRQRGRRGRRANCRAGRQQLLHPARSTGSAHEVAVDLGQRAKGSGNHSCGKHEGGNRTGRQCASDHIERALPQHQRDGAKHKANDQ